MAANRLKEVLDKCISPFQSAFVGGRYVADNYIVAHESLHSFKKIRKDKTIGLKLDMSKAYDRMEWNFIKETLKSMSFHIKFV